MIEILSLKNTLKQYAKIEEEDFALAAPYFHKRTWKQGESEPMEDKSGKKLAYITKGLFRSYFIDPKSAKEINTYFFQENQFMGSFLNFDSNNPCNYYFEALEDCEVVWINQKDLKTLFDQSHKWERFGRLLAEDYYRGSYARIESFTFISPEDRYLQLIKSFPKIFQRTSLLNISSYLGVESQSLSRIRKRIVHAKK